VRLSRQEEKLRAELVAELAAAAKLVDYRWRELLGLLRALPNDVNEAIQAYNVALLKAKVFAEGIAETFREEYDDKSDGWKEGDRGQAADSFISEWESIDWDQMQPVALLEPELEEPEVLKLSEALESLPGESE
jgi:hypothetical protein